MEPDTRSAKQRAAHAHVEPLFAAFQDERAPARKPQRSVLRAAWLLAAVIALALLVWEQAF
ncbi:MAG: hypothetical protein ACKVWV_19375 [Planctomycetota bacterium]